MKYYSIAEMAKELNIAPSTLSYRINKLFNDYIPFVQDGKNKKYTDKSIEILSFIDQQLTANVPVENIKEALGTEFGIPIVENKPQPTTAQQGYLEVVKRQNIQIETLLQYHFEYKKRIDELEDKITAISEQQQHNDNEALNELKSLKLALERGKTTWWGRLLKKS